MIYLILVSIIWALSFSLIKGNLTNIDSNLVALIRLGISFLIFLPFIKLKNVNKKLIGQFILIGFVQYGLMYVSYIYSYKFLEASQIAILTIFTPIYIVFTNILLTHKYRLVHLLTAILAVIGASIILYSNQITTEVWKGILLIQFSNLCFAFGQIYFKKIMNLNSDIKPVQIYALLYFGAVIVAGLFSLTFTNFNIVSVSSNQWLTLLYLGIVASGIGFFLWNVGVTKVEVGSLSITNNLKIPLAVLFAFLILGESIDLLRVIVGLLIILLALVINKKYSTE